MIFKNLIDSLSQLYFNLKEKVKKIYQNSSFYDKKISKTKDITFDYKPSPYLLSSIVKYQKKNQKKKKFFLIKNKPPIFNPNFKKTKKKI